MTAISRTIDLGTVHITLWGAPSATVTVTVHGKQSHQGDTDIVAARDHALSHGEQVITWDLPGHGARPGSPALCRITDAAADLETVWSWTVRNFESIRVFATSIGAYLALVTAPQARVEDASFLSPVVDMAGLVHGLMRASGTTPERLRAEGRIDTPAEPLEWSEYEFISAHPALPWRVPTRIPRGGHDDLVDPAAVDDFCARTGACLTTAPRSGHYFHTESDMRTLETWLRG